MSLEIKKLEKKFSNLKVLDGIDLKVSGGEIVFILGRSGTGKSVLLKSIVGLLKPDSGEIWIDEEEVSHLSEEKYVPIRKKCGMVFQHPALFDSLSVFENVAFGVRRHFSHYSEEKIKSVVLESLSLVELYGVENKMAFEISYGMQKRVSLARTLAIKPRYLLFDEPTTGLDPVITRAINKLIWRLSRKLKVTAIVVSHDMQCALEISDRIVVLDQGQIVEESNPQLIRTSKVPLVQEFLA